MARGSIRTGTSQEERIMISVLPNHLSQMGKITIPMSKKFSYYTQIMCVTCTNILKMGIRMSATKILWRTLMIGDLVDFAQEFSCSSWSYPNGPEAGRGAGWGSEFVPLKKSEVGSFILLHKISRTACCFRILTFLKQYNCYESATIWYTDHQYLAQYNLWEIPLIFCNYAVCSCGTWRKGPGQSPCNVLSISDLELYVTETSTGVCDPVTD